MLINFLGDSITEGYYATQPENSYVQIVKKILNVDVNNYGVGGSRIAKQYTPSVNARSDLYFALRVNELSETADLVVIFGGTNDYRSGDAPFGNTEDKTVDTFCGGCFELFSNIKDKFSKQPIVVVLPLHREGENETEICREKVKGVRYPLTVYREEIRRRAQEFGYYILDLWDVDELNPHVEAGKDSFFDGLHPNDKGHRILGEKIADFLSQIIKR